MTLPASRISARGQGVGGGGGGGGESVCVGGEVAGGREKW